MILYEQFFFVLYFTEILNIDVVYLNKHRFYSKMYVLYNVRVIVAH